jgi:hypothetical protein
MTDLSSFAKADDPVIANDSATRSIVLNDRDYWMPRLRAA